VYDTVRGAAAIALWTRTLGLDAVHARSQMPAAMALIARRLSRRPPALVFDIRGLMVEEYEEAGRWQPGSIPSRLTSAVQRAAIRTADQIVILTRRGRAKLFNRDDWDRVHVIPTCADLNLISAGHQQRDRVRRRLGLSEARVMVYVGKFPSWSMYTEMAAFFATARKTSANLHFLILTQADGTAMRTEFERHNVPPSSYTITSVPAEEMGDYLAASDFAIMFIRPAPSTVCQSPTKLGEFLGAGLPVVYTPGVGDVDELVSDHTGVRVAQHSTAAHDAAAVRVIDLLEDPNTAARCRSVAESRLSLDQVGVPGYLEVYNAVARLRPTAVRAVHGSGR
jgi:glycosyltransferase involved in cell wall biosynthesis